MKVIIMIVMILLILIVIDKLIIMGNIDVV
jgi:hypothetical protein